MPRVIRMLSSVQLTPGTLVVNEVFTPEQCEQIIQDATKWTKRKAEVYQSGTSATINPDTRLGNTYSCPQEIIHNAWWRSRIDSVAIHYLRKQYPISLNWTNIEIQMVEYADPGDLFGEHRDAHLTQQFYPGIMRKLSMSVELTNPKHYTGANLKIVNDDSSTIRPDTDQGDVVVFPSWQPHKVTELETGIRRALVVWYYGPFWT